MSMWKKFKKSVGDFFSDEYPEVSVKAIDTCADDDVTAEKVRTLLSSMHHEQGLLSLKAMISIGPEKMPKMPKTGVVDMLGFRYLFDTEAGLVEGVQMVPESFKKHIAWEKSLKPGMLGRMLRSITVEAPRWEVMKPNRSSLAQINAQPAFSFKADSDPIRSVDVSEGDILMFVGYLESDLAPVKQQIHEMYLPISVQQWIINERTVDFSFIEAEIDMFLSKKKEKY